GPSTPSFDHLVGAAEQRQRHSNAKRLCSLEIDDKLDFGCLLDRQLCRLFAFEDAADVDTGHSIGVFPAAPIAHQTAGCNKLRGLGDRRHAMTAGQLAELPDTAGERLAKADHEPADTEPGKVCERCIEVVDGSGMYDAELEPKRTPCRLH